MYGWVIKRKTARLLYQLFLTPAKNGFETRQLCAGTVVCVATNKFLQNVIGYWFEIVHFFYMTFLHVFLHLIHKHSIVYTVYALMKTAALQSKRQPFVSIKH